MKRTAYYGLLLLFAGIFVYSGIRLLSTYREYRAGEDSYEKLRSFAAFSLPKEEKEGVSFREASREDERENMEKELQEGVKERETGGYPVIDFSALEQMNDEVMGWIYLEDSPINYPVVRGGDNEYYLDHLFDGKYNRAGSIFMDFRNRVDLSDEHTIIYGHHMKNGSMFAGLSKYTEQAYYDSHPRGILVTKEGIYEILFFSGYVTDVLSDSWDLGWKDEEEKAAWIASAMQRSAFRADVDVDGKDSILTLSTCTYDFDDARFVLVGVLKKLP